MPIKIEWIIQDHILLNTLTEDVTKQELEEFIEQQLAIFNNSANTIDSITDIRELNSIDISLQSFLGLIRFNKIPQNFGLHVQVCQHSFIQSLSIAICNMLHIPNEQAFTIHSALQTILQKSTYQDQQDVEDIRWRWEIDRDLIWNSECLHSKKSYGGKVDNHNMYS